MISEYPTTKEWSDIYLPIANRILKDFEIPLNERKILISSPQKDKENATDLVMLQHPSYNIAVRVRSPKYWKRFDLTIRTLNNGYKTEIDKLKETTSARFYIYYWIRKNNTLSYKNDIAYWIIDLEKCRQRNLFDIWESRYDTILNYDQNRKLDGTGFIAIPKDVLLFYDVIIKEKDSRNYIRKEKGEKTIKSVTEWFNE